MLSTLTSKANLRRPAWVSAEALNVAPELLGAPLAKPAQRALAMGLDLLAIAVLSTLGGIWLGAALVLFVYRIHARAQQQGSRRLNAWLLGVGILCLLLAAERGWQRWSERNSPAAVAEAQTATYYDPAASPASALATSGRTAVLPAGKSQSDAERIEALEEQLAEALQPKAYRWQTELATRLDDLGVGFGWAIVYFALLPAWLQGQTLGKKLLGLRVVELTGKPLSVRLCFSRYGGYAAGIGTGGFGFAQILWDDNRQAIQDKVAHTVVIDLRAPFQAVETALDTSPEHTALIEPEGHG